MTLEACALCFPNRAAISTGGTPLETYYAGSDIKFHFPYEGFEWLPLLPAGWIHALVAIQALAGLTMALGFWYRASAAAVFLTWAYLWLVESTRTYWQSHFYLETLLTFLMIWMPAARRASIDAWLARGRNAPRSVPCWTILLLRGQLIIAYFYAGVAKLNVDWLCDAVPVRWFLTNPAVTAPYAPYLSPNQLDLFKATLHRVELAYFISYAGLAFDLSVGFLLLIRRTRVFALILMVLFHATNHLLIFDDIGWFPLMGIATALIFLNPDWPERAWNWLKRPRLAKPDWGWFAAGAIVFPFIGAALGWKSRPGQRATEPNERVPLSNYTVSLVTLWLIWQALMPLRQYAIPGDGRFTYEGNSFSWRLKSEIRHTFGHKIFIKDPAIISLGEAGRTRINWSEWHGDPVIYRNVVAGQMDWRSLPEIVVLIEPIIGERIVFNPWPGNLRTEAEARERVSRIWHELYGRDAPAIRRTMTLSQVLNTVSAALRSGGHSQEASQAAALASRASQFEADRSRSSSAMTSAVRTMLRALRARDKSGSMAPVLRPLAPFALEGERGGSAPFLLVEDPRLLNEQGQVNLKEWRNGRLNRDQKRLDYIHEGGEPLVIYLGDLGVEARELMPQAFLFDFQDQPERPPSIFWNSLKDLPPSKFLHASLQAFYLRRYARRVARLWELDYGRRPVVQASTQVSLNGRPHQDLVDPNVDLASVPVTLFGHNPWIRDLETPRIPREALAGRPSY